ncbi:MAG: peptide/nickel transport system permease protein [Pseudonocardiales bacterium]|nr:peptide/nickel transport system permease protein [Pseudonocardiales bacterium]
MRYLGKRLLLTVPTLLAVTMASFCLIKLLPGDPALRILGTHATEPAREELHRRLGLDRPFFVQYGLWLKHLLTGDWGQSYLTGLPIRHTIAAAIPVTAEVVLLSQALALAVAVPLATALAAHRGSAADRAGTVSAFALLAAPSFIVGVLLVYVFSVRWQLLPASGYAPLSDDVVANLRDMALPSLTLATASVPLFLRVLRADVVLSLEQEYVVAARSRGISRVRLLGTHALRPALPSLLTVAGVQLGGLFGGAVVVEYVFGLPGVGSVFLNGIFASDFLLVQACVVLFTVAYVLANLTVDLLQPLLDPRLRHAAARA